MRRKYWLISLIFLLALLLRLYKLETLPYNFHEDEVLSGYIGRFILQNGKDIYGNPWPLFYFNKFGDYYIIGPIYLSGLSTFIFGVNQFATRFPAAFLGALLVFPIYFLSLELLKDKKLSLISSFLYALSPWSVVLSRTTSEGVIGSFTFTLALVFLLKSIKSSSVKNLLISSLLLFTGYFIYHPFRVYPPLLLLATLVLLKTFQTKITKRYSIVLLSTFIFFAFLTFSISQTKWGKNRFLQTSIFSRVSGVELKMQDLIFTEKTKNLALVRLFHNKPWHFGREFLHQYLTYFSPNFLLFKSWEKLRYFVPEQGVLYISVLLLFYLGLARLILTKKSFEKYFLLFILLLAPLPAAFTVVESPNPHRAFFMIIPLSIIAALTFSRLRNLVSASLTLIFVFESFYFWHQYSTHHDYFSGELRNDGQKETAYLIKSLQKKYDKVYVFDSKAMSWYYLFYSNNFDKSLVGRFGLDAKIRNVGNVYFVNNSCPSNEEKLPDYTTKDAIVIIDRPECQSNLEKFKLIKTFSGKYPLLKYKVLEPKR